MGKSEILWRLEVGWGKVACWSTKAAISLKRVKIDEKFLYGSYRPLYGMATVRLFQTGGGSLKSKSVERSE